MPEDRRGAERLAELFEQALALPQEDRRRYARDTCRDEPELCAELVSLLAAYEEAPNYLERVGLQLRHAALTPTESVTPSSTSDRGIQAEVRLRVGQRFGHYEIGRLLGRGGMSEVWDAEDLDTGRHVALKALGWSLHSAADHARFLREGRLAARVNHPNIVYVFGTEEIDGVPAIAMELASGGTLKDLVTAEGPMRPARAVDVMLQVMAGLDAAAAAGVLHRDIKPSNCFVEAEGRIQIGDFGIAAATTVQPDATLTGTVGLLCTPTFASPEQLRGAPLDVRSDIYAVGATLYYLLSWTPAVRRCQRGPADRARAARTANWCAHRAARRSATARQHRSAVSREGSGRTAAVVRASVEAPSAVPIGVAGASAAGSADACPHHRCDDRAPCGRCAPVFRPDAVAATGVRQRARVARVWPGAFGTSGRLLRGLGRPCGPPPRARWSSVCAWSEQDDSRSA